MRLPPAALSCVAEAQRSGACVGTTAPCAGAELAAGGPAAAGSAGERKGENQSLSSSKFLLVIMTRALQNGAGHLQRVTRAATVT